MHRYASDFADGVEAVHGYVLAFCILRDRLAGHPRRNTAHHVVASGHHGDGRHHGIDVREGLGEFHDARQPRPQRLLAQVVELEKHVIALWPGAATLQNLQNHRARHYVATR